MERNFAQEIDQLRAELQEMKQLINDQSAAMQSFMQQQMTVFQTKIIEEAAPEQLPARTEGHIQKMPCMHPSQHIRAVLDELENTANSHNSSGCVTYIGTYESGGNQSTWVQHSIDIDPLLEQIESGIASKVLSCIGSNDRLRLLLALLKKPMTVQQMIAECGFNTSGQVYNHLRSLIAVDLVTEDEHGARGTYTIVPHRVSGLIMLLAGVHDLLNNEFSQADYSAADEE